MIKINEISIEWSSTKKIFDGGLNERNQSCNLDELEFEKRDNCKLNASLGSFGQSGISHNDENNLLIYQVILYNCQDFDSGSEEETKSIVAENNEFKCRGVSSLIALFGIFGLWRL